jgi:hypothetical protein
MAKAPGTIYGEVRPAIRALLDQGLTDEAIARVLRKRLSHVQSERYDYQRSKGVVIKSTPSLPSVSFIETPHDLTDADYYAGRAAQAAAGY